MYKLTGLCEICLVRSLDSNGQLHCQGFNKVVTKLSQLCDNLGDSDGLSSRLFIVTIETALCM